MRILFSTFGSLGDLHPYLAIALEAQKRGHEPIIATAPKYRAKVENLSLLFRPIRPDLPPTEEYAPLARRVMDGKDGPRYLFEEILSPAIREQTEDLLEACADADLIITHPAALGGPLAARKLNKKWLSSALAPISLWSELDIATPPTAPWLDWLRVLGPLWAKIYYGLGRQGTRGWIAPVERLRAEMGLEGEHPMFEGQFSPHGTLALWSPHFAPPQRDWPLNTTATGFCFYDSEGYDGPDEDDDWRYWAQQGAAPIVFTLGSSAVYDAGAFWHRSAEYATRLRTRAILLTGEPTGVDWPDNVLEVGYAPHSQIFPLASLIVHQGGAGTTAQALRAGAPQLVMPYAHDQPDNARRVRQLGVGKSISRQLYERGSRGDFALEIMTEARDECAGYARALGKRVRAEDGPRAACEAMERLIKS